MPSVQGTHGHCDRPGRLQQHLPLGADDGLHPEVNTLPGHRAPEHTGSSGERPQASTAGLGWWFSLRFFSRQVSVIQYGVDAKFEFRLNEYRNKEDMLKAAARITQMYGHSTNTFQAIQYARLVRRVAPSVLLWPLFSYPLTGCDLRLFAAVSQWGFHQSSGGRPGAAKVMVVVTDGESHDNTLRETVIAECNKKGITRFGIAVSDDPRSPHRRLEEKSSFSLIG